MSFWSSVDWSHFTLVFVDALSLRIWDSSCKQYFPWKSVWRKKWHSMIFVSASANCAPLWTHRNLTPSARKSFIAWAWSWVLNSEHDGVAVRVTRSNSDLQSVTAIDGSSLSVAVAYVGGNSLRVSVGFRQSVRGSLIQLQNSLNHDSWSNVELSDVVSAASVLVTTLWIFLHPQLMGLTGQTWFFPMSSCVVMIMVPVWDSGCFLRGKRCIWKR